MLKLNRPRKPILQEIVRRMVPEPVWKFPDGVQPSDCQALESR